MGLYILKFQRWFFSPAIDPIEKWSFNSNEGAVSEHLKFCPYNIRTLHNPIPKDNKIWPEVLNALKFKMSERKAASKWFVSNCTEGLVSFMLDKNWSIHSVGFTKSSLAWLGQKGTRLSVTNYWCYRIKLENNIFYVTWGCLKY